MESAYNVDGHANFVGGFLYGGYALAGKVVEYLNWKNHGVFPMMIIY